MQGYTNASAAATIRLVNQSATFTTQSTPDYAAYPCRAAITITGCTTLKQATVTYNPTEAISGNYAPFCETYNGGVYLYSKVESTIQVAAIVLEGVSNFYNMEATPTQNSGNPITSGGVYTNCVRTTDDQPIAGTKTFTNDPWIIRPTVPTLCLKETTNQVSTPTSGWTSVGVVRFLDKNSQHFSVVEAVQDGSYRSIYFNLNTSRTAGTDKWTGQIGIGSNAEDVIWAFAPYRTYVKTNTSDIMTIGHLNSAIEIDGTKYFTGTTTSPNHNLRNASLVQSANSSAGSMTLNFLGRNSANTGDISRAYIQFYHAPGSNSASSTNLLYLRGYADNCSDFVDLSMDGTNKYVSTNGTMSAAGLRVGGQQVAQLCNSSYNNTPGTWGVLTSANGYTGVMSVWRNGGAIEIAEKSQAFYLQLDGCMYQRNNYRVIDEGDRDNTTTIGSLMNLTNWTPSTNLTTRNTIAHWDGSYQSSPKMSNLAYCVHGAMGTACVHNLTISSGGPSGGSNGDIWVQY